MGRAGGYAQQVVALVEGFPQSSSTEGRSVQGGAAVGSGNAESLRGLAPCTHPRARRHSYARLLMEISSAGGTA